MSFTQHFAAISQVFSDCMHICSFQQCQYCEIGNVSMGFSKSLMPKILYKSLVFDSWFDKIFGICDLENPILTFPPHSIVSFMPQTSEHILDVIDFRDQLKLQQQCHLISKDLWCFFSSCAFIIVANSDDGWHIFVIGSASPRWLLSPLVWMNNLWLGCNQRVCSRMTIFCSSYQVHCI